MRTKQTPKKNRNTAPNLTPVTISVYWDSDLHRRFSAHCENLRTNTSARLRALALRDLDGEGSTL